MTPGRRSAAARKCLFSRHKIENSTITGPEGPVIVFAPRAPSRRTERRCVQQSGVDHGHDQDVDAVMRRLRRFYEGVLEVGGRFDPVQFVLDPATARPVFPAMPGALEGEELTLHVPEDEPGAVRIAGRPMELDPLRDEACDRWLIYFGKARWGRFCAMDLDHIKSVDLVIDAGDIRGNPLKGVEAALLREVNAAPVLLASACERMAKVRPSAPRAIGVDPCGLDVRAEFGPVRIELEGVHATEEAARRAVRALLEGGS
jgi:hypothetical protein